jgi:diguanylate cyclase (GGDEF)-like protein
MQAQLHQAIHLICAVMSVCFSFCILVLAVLFKNTARRPRLYALAFLPVFMLNLASALSHDAETSAVLVQNADVLLLIGIIAAILSRTGAVSAFFSITAPPAAITAIFLSARFREFLYVHQPGPMLTILIAAAVLYLLKNEKGSEGLVFWSAVTFAASGPANLFLRTGIAAPTAPLLSLASYIIMLRYFYKVFLKHLIDEYESTKKKLSDMDRSIEAEVKKRMREVEKVNRKLLDKSKADPLTGLLNKAAILDAIDGLIASKPDREHSILMFDIDDFKDINDNHGHIAGDRCIKTLATVTRNNFRTFDLAGRYGGDEFIAVLPETGTRLAVAIAERFRKTIDETSSPHFTISIGVSSYPGDGRDARSLVEIADRGLYRSKGKGKNAVSYGDAY